MRVDMPVPRAWISIGMSCVSCVVVWTAKRFLRDYTVSPTVTERGRAWARWRAARALDGWSLASPSGPNSTARTRYAENSEGGILRAASLPEVTRGVFRYNSPCGAVGCTLQRCSRNLPCQDIGRIFFRVLARRPCAFCGLRAQLHDSKTGVRTSVARVARPRARLT